VLTGAVSVRDGHVLEGKIANAFTRGLARRVMGGMQWIA